VPCRGGFGPVMMTNECMVTVSVAPNTDEVTKPAKCLIYRAENAA